ncbi:alanyl-tRNA synthetase [Entomoplasma freundtii]|uniref:alanine--tRNA ligase-related protein n=1 Tax=Entomoplasma freundtii TaxID=74700 RepID=UPI000C28CABF|nr:alanine--tRNA ligase-related protein [Entomoplasma freundtii]TDY56031.1 alanyl-tRNA synthetase [Entomoplasma freundtii]
MPNNLRNDNLVKVTSLVANLPRTTFVGFESLSSQGQIIALFDEDWKPINKLTGHGWVLLNKTPFFAEGGGQASDRGYFEKDQQQISLIAVNKDVVAGYFFHKVATNAKTELAIGDSLNAFVDEKWRHDSSKNHSALHITWQATLNQLDHFVDEVGSKLNGDKYQLQLANDPSLTPEVAWEATKHVNEIWIPANIAPNIFEISPEEAKAKNYLYEFTKVNPWELVRIVEFPTIITEPCSGTHVKSTKEMEQIYFLDFERKAKSIVIDMTANYDFAQQWFFDKLVTKIKTLVDKMHQYPQIDFVDITEELMGLEKSWNYLSIRRVNALVNDITKRINQFEKEQVKLITAESQNPANWNQISKGEFVFWETSNPNFTNKILLPLAINEVKKANRPLVFLNTFASGANCILIKPASLENDLKTLAQKLLTKTSLKGGGQPTLIQMVSNEPLPKQEIYKIFEK